MWWSPGLPRKASRRWCARRPLTSEEAEDGGFLCWRAGGAHGPLGPSGVLCSRGRVAGPKAGFGVRGPSCGVWKDRAPGEGCSSAYLTVGGPPMDWCPLWPLNDAAWDLSPGARDGGGAAFPAVGAPDLQALLPRWWAGGSCDQGPSLAPARRGRGGRPWQVQPLLAGRTGTLGALKSLPNLRQRDLSTHSFFLQNKRFPLNEICS